MSRPGSTLRVPVRTYRGGKLSSGEDLLTTEEPLEIRIAPFGAPPVALAVTMRTPGSDFELAAGFLHSEGILESPDQVHRIAYCADVARSEQQYNIVTVELRPGCRPRLPDEERRFAMTAACGVCGKASIEAMKGRELSPLYDDRKVSVETLLSLPAALRDAQSLFHKTGGLHAAALFDGGDRLVALREDVGRH